MCLDILHVFSCRLYGLNKYKKQISEDKKIAAELQNRDRSNSAADTDN
jgi:putative resolvase